MSKNINICIVGCGNCASSFLQGLAYYKNIKDEKYISGLMHKSLGGYDIKDIRIVASFDIDKRKVDKDLSIAIFSEPNCTKKFSDVPFQNVDVMKGPIFDGIAPHMKDYFQVDEDQKELTKDEIITILKKSKADILVSYLPVGSQKATEFWAQIAIDSGCAFVNCIPIFIASNKEWAKKFEDAGIPIIGDDIKSEIGATIVNRTLVQMIEDRGGYIENTYQLNIGGNTDFRNMTDPSRLASKKISKTESISSLIHDKSAYVYAGPNGCIDCLLDNKISFMRIDFRIFGNIPCSIDVKLNVEDSPNSAGVVIDAVRIAKMALDKRIGGPIISACAYYMKHPIQNYEDHIAHQMVEDFINGNREN